MLDGCSYKKSLLRAVNLAREYEQWEESVLQLQYLPSEEKSPQPQVSASLVNTPKVWPQLAVDLRSAQSLAATTKVSEQATCFLYCDLEAGRTRSPQHRAVGAPARQTGGQTDRAHYSLKLAEHLFQPQVEGQDHPRACGAREPAARELEGRGVL